ncbi:uncharacterized protein PG998_010353 [Apiospora kogelbergensis]|uniref:uncharacterized protein n=1 Tax=Apiospora kogelbergensis TaxID=1337665 RepID=UPI003131B0DB
MPYTPNPTELINMGQSQPYEYYAITGIKAGWGLDGPGSVPTRQEINEWSSKAENEKQVNLFLLALRRLQDVPPDSRDSFFQIAGIHGMPFKGWDEPNTTPKDAKDKGYCTHANALFPPWHRPYMLLYEQQLYDVMVKQIIPNFPKSEQQSWQQAADTWRLPFWDWAANPRIPALADKPEVTVTAPPGQKVRIENPLYQFRMPNDEPMSTQGVGTVTTDEEESFEYGVCYATSRCPLEGQTKSESNDWIEGVVNNEEVTRYMADHIDVKDKDRGAAAELVYRLMTYPLTYEQFATVNVDGKKGTSEETDVNLEFIHNNIHWWVGGEGGHMSQIPVATFDPMFWLHHCYLDRLFAIWQQLNQDKWFTESPQGDFPQRTIGIPKGDNIRSTTPLRPFHKDKAGAVWTPNEVRNHFDLGYTYSGIEPWKPEYQTGGQPDRAKLVKSLKELINTQYGKCRQQAIEILDEAVSSGQTGGGGAPANAVAIATSTGGSATAIARAFSNPSDGPAAPGPVPRGMKIISGGAGIESNDFAISVCLAPADASQPPDLARDYIGSVYNFSSPATNNGETVCSNCSTLERQNVMMSAYLPINLLLNKLLKENSLASLEKDEVESLLQRLYWRVTKYGKEVPEDQLQNLRLQIVVSVNTASHFKDASKPSGFANFSVIPSLGIGSGVNNDPPTSSTSSESRLSDATQIPSDTQYLALDKTIRLKKPVPQGGIITVESASISLTKADVGEDSTGISFMHFDESNNQDRYKESNYDVLLSVSIRRPDVLRLNGKKAHQGWGQQKDIRLDRQWFKAPNPKFEVREKDGDFEVYIDGVHVGSCKKKINKEITHVQYWIKDKDKSTSALSYALLVQVITTEPGIL